MSGAAGLNPFSDPYAPLHVGAQSAGHIPAWGVTSTVVTPREFPWVVRSVNWTPVAGEAEPVVVPSMGWLRAVGLVVTYTTAAPGTNYDLPVAELVPYAPAALCSSISLRSQRVRRPVPGAQLTTLRLIDAHERLPRDLYPGRVSPGGVGAAGVDLYQGAQIQRMLVPFPGLEGDFAESPLHTAYLEPLELCVTVPTLTTLFVSGTSTITATWNFWFRELAHPERHFTLRYRPDQDTAVGNAWRTRNWFVEATTALDTSTDLTLDATQYASRTQLVLDPTHAASLNGYGIYNTTSNWTSRVRYHSGVDVYLVDEMDADATAYLSNDVSFYAPDQLVSTYLMCKYPVARTLVEAVGADGVTRSPITRWRLRTGETTWLDFTADAWSNVWGNFAPKSRRATSEAASDAVDYLTLDWSTLPLPGKGDDGGWLPLHRHEAWALDVWVSPVEPVTVRISHEYWVHVVLKDRELTAAPVFIQQ